MYIISQSNGDAYKELTGYVSRISNFKTLIFLVKCVVAWFLLCLFTFCYYNYPR